MILKNDYTIEKFSNFNIPIGDFLSEGLKLIIVKENETSSISIYDYWNRYNNYFTLISLIRERYINKYVMYKENTDILNQIKLINDYALPLFTLKLLHYNQLREIDYKTSNKMSKNSTLTNDTVNSTNTKKADNPNSENGDIIEKYTTEQIKDENTIINNQSINDEIINEGDILVKFLTYSESNEEYLKLINDYLDNFRPLFIFFNPIEEEEYI